MAACEHASHPVNSVQIWTPRLLARADMGEGAGGIGTVACAADDTRDSAADAGAVALAVLGADGVGGEQTCAWRWRLTAAQRAESDTRSAVE